MAAIQADHRDALAVPMRQGVLILLLLPASSAAAPQNLRELADKLVVLHSPEAHNMTVTIITNTNKDDEATSAKVESVGHNKKQFKKRKNKQQAKRDQSFDQGSKK
jgi:hypothetical protein